MSNIITIDPVTRISGFLEIQALAENNKIVNANSLGLLFRGFEKILKGRHPTDAINITERICGICSTAHAMASTLALENAFGIVPALNDSYVRDILHGFEFLQNHLRQFYQFTIPGYARITAVPIADIQSYQDYRFPEEINRRMEEHYIASLEYSRLAHEGVAILGAKAPHNHGIFVGGVTATINAFNLQKIRSIINQIQSFVTTAMREDMDTISQYYSDYYEKGISYPNFLTYGLMGGYSENDLTYVKPGVMVNGVLYPLLPDQITEQIQHAWYVHDNQGEEITDLSKADAYTFIKAPRYSGLPMEVGPLARMMISGLYTRGHSCMDRNYARVLETEKIGQIIISLLDRIQMEPNSQRIVTIPQTAFGVGMVDTTRGALGHWIGIENQLISHYNIITPSVWNLSPKGMDGLPGVAEQALIDTVINNIEEPIEIGRIIRSFDPCVSCATHLIEQNGKEKIIEMII